MTNPKWTVAFLLLFVVCTALSSIVEGAELVAGQTRLERFFDIGWSTLLPHNLWSWMGNLFQMFWFDYAFLAESPYNLVKFFIFWPISAGLVISILMRLLTSLLIGKGRLI